MNKALYYDVPEHATFVSCRSCGTKITFVKTPTGKKMPVDEDGRSHFQTCTHPNRHSKSKRR